MHLVRHLVCSIVLPVTNIIDYIYVIIKQNLHCSYARRKTAERTLARGGRQTTDNVCKAFGRATVGSHC